MRQVPRGSVSVLPILSLPAVLRECGADPAQVFGQAAIDARIFETSDGSIPYRDLGRLLEISAANAGRPHLGLLIGARCDMSSFGAIGALAAHAPDIGTALGDFIKHMPKWDRAAVVTLKADHESATFSFVIDEADFPGARIIREGAVAIMVRVLRHFFGASWSPDLVLFPHRARGPGYPYRRYFSAPVQFGTGSAGIVFPQHLLNRRVTSADGSLRAGRTARHAASDQARRQILLSLPVGPIEQTGVARALGMNVSTMRRRLAREGTSFRELSHAIRYEAAKHLIRDSGLTLAEVAASLGYAELSVFSRAFRRWSGRTPSDWRGNNPEHQPDL